MTEEKKISEELDNEVKETGFHTEENDVYRSESTLKGGMPEESGNETFTGTNARLVPEFIRSNNKIHGEEVSGKTARPENGWFRKGKRKMAGVVAGIMLLSAISGYGGSFIAQSLNGSSNSGTSNTEVLYQSVTKTSTGSTTSGSTLTIADIAALTADSVVAITTETVSTGNRMQQYVSEGAGSGVILTTDGYIVTNNHVIDGASKITVTLNSKETYTAQLVGSDAQTDLAVLKIEASDLQPVVLGDSDTLQVGELAVAVGNPLGELGGTVTDGIISALDRELTIDGQSMNLLQTNAAINPGNSGGGLFNERGELIGIVNAKSSGTGIEGLGFAIPVNTAKTVIEQLIAFGYVQGRVELGMTLLDITDTRTAMMYRVQQLGVYVLKVTEGSAAETAGFQSGDLIASIEGTAVETSDDVTSVLEGKSVGDTLKVVVVRSGQNVTMTLTLGEYKPL